MKRKSSIIKLTLIGVVLVIGIVLSVCSFSLPFSYYNYNSFASSIKLGLDLKGGVYAVYDTESAGVDNFESKLEGTQKRLQDLLVSKGYTEALVTIENKTRLRVEVPDVDNPSAIFELISTANIQEAITGGRAQITMSGQDTQAAVDLASQIMSGTFDVKLSLKESSTISPTLGEQALFLGIIAGAVGLLLVIAFLIWRYRLFGVVATIALLIYAVLMLFFLSVFPWVQLTLPGIAGIILSLGMAVDGNIIIYERIRDEYRDGKSILASLHAGFKKATVAIFDSNITTIIAAIILIIFGSGSITGFGITLLIGIILSMFTSLVVTRGLCKYFTNINNANEKLYGLKRGKNYVPGQFEEEEEVTAEEVETTTAAPAGETEGAQA